MDRLSILSKKLAPIKQNFMCRTTFSWKLKCHVWANCQYFPTKLAKLKTICHVWANCQHFSRKLATMEQMLCECGLPIFLWKTSYRKSKCYVWANCLYTSSSSSSSPLRKLQSRSCERTDNPRKVGLKLVIGF